MITCDNCQREYDPIAFRWLCPHCGWKASCCEGEPQS
jgi:Zn finger protein HypA/HybF involved in hydrogenase expression